MLLLTICSICWVGTESAFKNILTSLRKPGGGEYGKYYSLSALNDLRMGNASDVLLLLC